MEKFKAQLDYIIEKSGLTPGDLEGAARLAISNEVARLKTGGVNIVQSSGGRASQNAADDEFLIAKRIADLSAFDETEAKVCPRDKICCVSRDGERVWFAFRSRYYRTGLDGRGLDAYIEGKRRWVLLDRNQFDANRIEDVYVYNFLRDPTRNKKLASYTEALNIAREEWLEE